MEKYRPYNIKMILKNNNRMGEFYSTLGLLYNQSKRQCGDGRQVKNRTENSEIYAQLTFYKGTKQFNSNLATMLWICTKTTGNKRKNKFYFIWTSSGQRKEFLCIKGHSQQNKKATHGMGENICKSCI